MSDPFSNNIVRIQTADGHTVGAGFLAGPSHILSCAHVVRLALGLARDHAEKPTDPVKIDFPLLPGKPGLTARVVAWQPETDIAGLTPIDPLPDAAAPAPIARQADLWEHRFRALGFPKGRSNGVYARGDILGLQADGWLHVEATADTGYAITQGFSGGPVWDDALEAVVGFVTVADTAPGVRAAFIIPVARLADAWPEAFAAPAAPAPEPAAPIVDPVLRQLRRQLAGGQVTLFAGSDLAGAAGLPDMIALFRPLGAAIGQPLPPHAYVTADHILNTAQSYESVMGRNALISHLRDELDTTLVTPSACQRALAALNANTIFTTTYDDLLERALRDARRRVNVVVRDTSLALNNPEIVQLIKLRGDLHQPDTLVVTRQQHNEYALKHPLLVRELQTRLVNSTFLFVGFDLADPDFNLVFDQIAYQVDDARRLHYAVLFDAPPLKRDELRGRGVHVFNLETAGHADKWALLADWLGDLSRE